MNAFLLLQQNPIILAVCLLVLGACVGSFLNVVIFRLPKRLQYEWQLQCLQLLDRADTVDDTDAPPGVVFTPSHCMQCKIPIKAWHNLPIIGYFLIRGKCAACGCKISCRYPLIELITALLTLHAGWVFPFGIELLAALFFLWTLIALAGIDFDWQLLPDNITLPLLWVGLLLNTMNTFTSLHSAVFGAVIGYLALWLLYQAHFRLTGKQGMGYGDFKLLAAIGAWLGWQQLPLVALLASLVGTILAGFLILRKRHDKDVPISFGPFLAMAAWVTLVWGDVITTNYLQLFNLS